MIVTTGGRRCKKQWVCKGSLILAHNPTTQTIMIRTNATTSKKTMQWATVDLLQSKKTKIDSNISL